MAEGNDPALDKVVPQDVLWKEKKAIEKDPMILVRLGWLRIKDKKQSLSPLQPNHIQLKVLQTIYDIRKTGKPIRLCILKGRQFGISTLMEALIYAYTTQWSNMNSIIISDDDDGSNYLFEMTKLYYEYMKREYPHVTPDKKISNEKKLEFMHKHSQILIDTAQNVDAGRKYTFHTAHLSEASRFRDFSSVLLSLMNSVPDEPNTFVAIETTANGDNDFAKFWWQITEEAKRGETDWVPLFLSWKDHPEYTKDFYTDSEKDAFIKTMSEEEVLIQREHGLSLGQMNWRRSTIKNKCQGKVDSFRQEYPLSPEEAFLTTGRRVFGEMFTRPQEKNIEKPKYVGEVALVEKRPVFMPQTDGLLRVYRPPQKGHRYVIGADASAGLEGGDYTCAQVLDRTTWEQVAVLHGTIPPDAFGDQLFALGAWYGWALIAPEIQRDGLVTILKLRDSFYPQIVHRTRLNFDDVTDIKESEELGWDTNVKTKPILISDLREALADMLMVVHDDDTLREIRKYSVLDTSESGYNAYGAPKGHHDDRVMALAIAIHFAKTLPETTTRSSPTMPQNLSQKRTGY